MSAIQGEHMTSPDVPTIPLQVVDAFLEFLKGLIPAGSRAVVFEIIFVAFLALGTLVGIVVISYMLWNAYKFRATDGEDKYAYERPEMGEVPQGGGKGRKLFLSFGLSALIVVSLIFWTYGAVLYVEQPVQEVSEDTNTGEPVEIRVIGYQFGWDYEYTGYDAESNTMVVPKDRPIALTVTSRDVWHNFGIPEFRVKSDAIPGETTQSWFIAEETGEYEAKCYELCGGGHSAMVETVRVVDEEEWEQWKAENLENGNGSLGTSETGTQGSADDGRLTAPETAPSAPGTMRGQPRIIGGT